MAANMHLYSEEDIIYGDYAFQKWDPELVADLLTQVNPKNMRLDLVTKSFNKSSPGTDLQTLFSTRHTSHLLPTNFSIFVYYLLSPDCSSIIGSII